MESRGRLAKRLLGFQIEVALLGSDAHLQPVPGLPSSICNVLLTEEINAGGRVQHEEVPFRHDSSDVGAGGAQDTDDVQDKGGRGSMDRSVKKIEMARDATAPTPLRAAAARPATRRPTRSEAEAAVRTLLAWAGDDPDREGLVETPKRVVEAYGEHFAGYREDPIAVLDCTFDEASGYDGMVMLRGIRVESHCEHHIAPFIGVAHVAYLPSGRIVGISKLARVVEVFAKRLQTQESLTAEIVDAIERALTPRGIAILIEAEHQCMSTRGVHQHGVATITSRYTGLFDSNESHRERFLRLAQK